MTIDPHIVKLRARAGVLREQLDALYPGLFSLTDPKPFAIGIRQRLKAAHPEFKREVVNNLFSWLTNRRAYFMACAIPGAPRYGFDGPLGDVTHKQAAHARRRFVERNASASDPWPRERFAA